MSYIEVELYTIRSHAQVRTARLLISMKFQQATSKLFEEMPFSI